MHVRACVRACARTYVRARVRVLVGVAVCVLTCERERDFIARNGIKPVLIAMKTRCIVSSIHGAGVCRAESIDPPCWVECSHSPPE